MGRGVIEGQLGAFGGLRALPDPRVSDVGEVGLTRGTSKFRLVANTTVALGTALAVPAGHTSPLFRNQPTSELWRRCSFAASSLLRLICCCVFT